MSEETIAAAVERAVVLHFGRAPVRASVSFVGVETLEVLRFALTGGVLAYVTSGMSRHPMTAASDAIRDGEGPRAELVLQVSDPHERFGDIWRRLALLGAAPAVEGVVYRPGMSVDLGEPLAVGSLCTGVLVTESIIGAVRVDGDVVSVLQVIPATMTELAWCRVHGTDSLRSTWDREGTDTTDLGRSPVSLH